MKRIEGVDCAIGAASQQTDGMPSGLSGGNGVVLISRLRYGMPYLGFFVRVGIRTFFFFGGQAMGIRELLLLAVGLSMDAFAVAVCKGLSVGKPKPQH